MSVVAVEGNGVSGCVVWFWLLGVTVGVLSLGLGRPSHAFLSLSFFFSFSFSSSFSFGVGFTKFFRAYLEVFLLILSIFVFVVVCVFWIGGLLGCVVE